MLNFLKMDYLILGLFPVQSTRFVVSLLNRWKLKCDHSTSSGWGQQRPWASESDHAGPSNYLLRKKPNESCLKRTIPYVSLATDSSGRNVCVDSIISNVYIKIPDENVCTDNFK